MSSPANRLLLLLLALALAACGSDPAVPASSYDGPVTEADWYLTPAAYRDQDGLLLAYSCPKDPEAMGPLWGTDVYSDDSSVCVAGVHAGALTPESGGTVVIEIRPGESSYTGSTRNGITSAGWGGWDGSFAVLR